MLVTPLGITMDESEIQLSNAKFPILVTLLGITTDESEEQYWNT